MSTDANQIPYRVGIPQDLLDQGWQFFMRESASPFIGEHEEWELSTGGYPTANEAVEMARKLTAEEEERLAIKEAERKAIASDGADHDDDWIEVKPGEQLWPVAEIRTDGGTQPRTELNMHTVADYAESMREGAKFPPVVLFFDGKYAWLADGFHRYAATKECADPTILADVRPGSPRDALLYSLGANATHGLHRTNEDKRRAVRTMFEDEEWSKWSDNVIAKKCGVSQPFVSGLRRELTTQNVLSEQPIRTGVDGISRDTSNIGKEAEADQRQTTLADIPGVELPAPPRDPSEDEEHAWSSASMVASESDPGEIARNTQQAEASATEPSDKPWTPEEVVELLSRHGGMLYRGQLEEMGPSYAAIHNALSVGAIAQPETGKFTLPDYKAQPASLSAQMTSRATPAAAPKPKPTIEEMLKGRPLVVSLTWIPALKGKVSVSVNMGNKPTEAKRLVIESDKAPRFPEEILVAIHGQLKAVRTEEYTAKTKPKVKKGSAPSKSAAKRAARKPAAKKTGKKKAAKRGGINGSRSR